MIMETDKPGVQTCLVIGFQGDREPKGNILKNVPNTGLCV